MKKRFLSILTTLLLVSCGGFSSNDNFPSGDSFSSSSSMTSEEEINIEHHYEKHPTSEPNYGVQLKVLNHIGDINTTWDYYRGEGVTLAVIDSGFDYQHPEFINEDGSSRVSDKSVYIYTDASGKTHRKSGIENVGITDGDSHGTMCAGLAASGVNSTGISGVAPECELVLIKIDKKAQSMADAFRYCGDNNIKVVSVSLGMYPSSSGASSGDIIFEAGLDLSTYFNDSISYAYSKGVTIVAATGNSKTTTVSYPAGCDYVIGAGGLNKDSSTLIWDEGYEGSNYNGSVRYVDVFAPSSGIYAPGYDASSNKSTYWDEGKGTSFAAPIVAGIAALYFQKYNTATNADFEKALKETCVNISSYNGNKDMGYGRIDVGALLNINEDKKELDYNPSTTVNKTATNIHFEDEAGWDLKTLHIYNFRFASGYGYHDLERFFDYTYGRVSTSSYKLEGTTKCWAYSDEGWSGDYFINIGNTTKGSQTNYDYLLPWWVSGATYQFVNNNNWLPVQGLIFSKTNGYGKIINNYFYYNSSSDTGVSKTNGEAYNYDYPAVNVYINDQQVDKTIVYDYYENNSCYINKAKTIKYLRNILTQDTYLYK